jgi:hypothetical protein
MPIRLRLSRAGLSALLALTLLTPGCALLIGGAAAGGAAGVTASVKERHEEARHGALTYVGTVLANVVYFPAKVVFAGAGAVTSGVTYLATLGNERTTASVWDATVKGDYVVTPRMIDGTQPVRFVG